MKLLIFTLLPKKLASHLLGIVASIQIPKVILCLFLKIYCFIYKVNQEEMLRPLSEYISFQDFFTRKLKEGSRSISSEVDDIISPVDGIVSACGEIKDGEILQVKGIYFQVKDFIGSQLAQQFKEGYFVTLYLSPGDYHRIHAPLSGNVTAISRVNGTLWPVNQFGINNILGLYTVNERVINVIQNQSQTVLLVAVGAFGVGSVKMPYLSERMPSQRKPVLSSTSYKIKKDDEIGYFNMGSTVVLLFEKNKFCPINIKKDDTILKGQTIGKSI